MRFTAVLVCAASSLPSLASARIFGFAAPLTIAPDSDVRIQILAQGYIQTEQDVAFSFGLAQAAEAYPGALGTLLDSKFLGPDDSNIVGNITHVVHVPATTQPGAFVLGGAHFSLIGALLNPSVESYALNVTVGTATSSEYAQSTLVTQQ